MQMGIGRLGDPRLIIKRKFRFTLEINTPVGYIPTSYVQVASRPNIEIGEVEIPFLNATAYVPGKAKYEPLSVTYIDTNAIEMQPLYSWIASIHDFTQPNDLKSTEKAGWSSYALLTIWDSCGTAIEKWGFGDCWPKGIDFGGVDMGDDDLAKIDLTLRYNHLYYFGLCGPNPIPIHIGC